MQKLYGIRELIGGSWAIVPISKATLYRMIAAGTFPKQRKLGHRSVWTEEDISRWRERWLGGEQ
jgi:predicted DNA-binding transcriptional regulator AlpA